MPVFDENLSVGEIYLIEDGLETYVFDPSIGDNIRVFIQTLGNTSLFPIAKTYEYINGDFTYTSPNETDIVLKPNDIFASDSTIPDGNYTIQFNFVRDYLIDLFKDDIYRDYLGVFPEGSENEGSYIADTFYDDRKPFFQIEEVSSTGREIRVSLFTEIDDPLNPGAGGSRIPFDEELQNAFKRTLGTINTEDEFPAFKFRHNVWPGNDSYSPVINYLFDSVSNPNQITLIFRLHTSVSALASPGQRLLLEEELFLQQSQNITYLNQPPDFLDGNPLEPDESFIVSDNIIEDTYENYEQLFESSSINSEASDAFIEDINDEFHNLSINHSLFKNHIFFGSAVKKLENFKTKAVEIEGYLNELSQSLQNSHHHGTGSANYILSKNQLLNSDYENGTDNTFGTTFPTHWSGSTTIADGAIGKLRQASDSNTGNFSAYMDLTHGGNSSDDVQVFQDTNTRTDNTNLNVTKGMFYRIEFYAKAAAGRDIEVKVTNTAGSTVHMTQTVTLTTSYEKFVYILKSDNTDSTAKFSFYLGNDNNDVFIDDVKFQEVRDYQTRTFVKQRREELFTKIRDVKKNFTPYEKFMYYDGQLTSTASAPGLGRNLATRTVSGLDMRDPQYHELKNNFDGFKTVFKYHNSGSTPLPSGGDDATGENGTVQHRQYISYQLYSAQEPPFFNYSGSVYFSFLAKPSTKALISDFDDAPGTRAFKVWNTNGWGSNGVGPKIPYSAKHSKNISVPNGNATGSEYRRFIYMASQSAWRPTRNINDEGAGPTLADLGATIDVADWYRDENEDVYYNILPGDKFFSSSMSSSFGDGYAHGIQDTSGQFGELVYPQRYSQPFGELDLLTPRSGSVLPAGELHRIGFTPLVNAYTASYFTDVRVHLKDPSNTHPFSNIYRPPSGSYVGSTEWNNWYTGIHASASQFDTDNIHSLFNNLPSYIKDNPDEHEDMKTFLDMLGEHFDMIRIYIDNLLTFNKRGFNKFDAAPNSLLPIISQNLGWEVINPYISTLSDYFSGTTYDAEDSEQVENTGVHTLNAQETTNQVWRRVLANLVYIYKTKGTHNSIRALMNCYGIPPDLLPLQEYGGTTEESNPEYITNDSTNLQLGLKNSVGNITYREKPKVHYSLRFSDTGSVDMTKKNHLRLPWWYNSADGEAVEFVLQVKPSLSSQTILVNSGSGTGSMWDIILEPESTTFLSGSSPGNSRITFRLNNTETGSFDMASNAVSMSTAYVPIQNNGLWNVIIQRVSSSISGSGTQTYKLFTGQKYKSGYNNLSFVSMSVSGGLTIDSNYRANQNWSSTGSRASTYVSGNLVFGSNFTGSLSEVRVWNSELSASKFKQHILSPSNFTGNSRLSSQNELIYRFPLNENTVYSNSASRYTYDATSQWGTDYKQILEFTGSSTGSQLYNKTQITELLLTTRTDGFDRQNNNKVLIDTNPLTQKRFGELSPFQNNQQTIYQKHSPPKRYNSKRVELILNVNQKLDDYLMNQLSDIDIQELYGAPINQYSSSYEALDEFKKTMYKGVNIDVNKYISSNKGLIYNNSLYEGINSLIPAAAKFDGGTIMFKPTILERNKIKIHQASVEQEIYHSGSYWNYWEDVDISSENPKYINFTNSAVEIPFGNNDSLILSNSIDISNSEYDPPKETNKIELGSGSIDISNSEYDPPKESNKIQLGSGSIDISNSEYHQPYESNELQLSSGSIDITNSEYHQPYESNELQLGSGSIDITNSEYEQPYESNELQLGSGSIELSSEYDLPKETNKLDLGSGSIELSSEYDTPKETNKLDLGSGSIELSSEYNPIHESGSEVQITNLPGIKSGSITLEGSFVSLASGSITEIRDRNIFSDGVDLQNKLYPTASALHHLQDVGTVRKNIWEAWGTGSNDVHFLPSIHFVSQYDIPTGDFSDNIGHYNYRDYVSYAIGDMEEFSASIHFVSCSDLDSTQCYAGSGMEFYNHKYFMNRLYIDVGKGYTYDTYFEHTGSIDGKMIGRTRFFSTGSDGKEVYPTNHFINFPTSKLNKLTYEGTRTHETASCVDVKSGNITECFPGKGYIPDDLFPHLAYYSITVSEDGGNVLKVKRDE